MSERYRKQQGHCRRDRCDRNAVRRGLCHSHYQQFLNHRALGAPKGLEPTADVAAHLARLRAAGLGTRRIGELAGLKPHTVLRIPQQQWVYRRTADALRRIPVPDIPHRVASRGARVPALGTSRRLQALVAIGYPQNDLARRLGGMDESLISALTQGKRRLVNADTARKVENLFTEIEEQPAQLGRRSEQARARAARMGWLPPIVWNPDIIDDPAATPEVRTEPRRLRIPPYFADEYIDYRDHVGLTDEQIAERFGITVDGLLKRLRGVGIPPQTPCGFQPGNTERRAS